MWQYVSWCEQLIKQNNNNMNICDEENQHNVVNKGTFMQINYTFGEDTTLPVVKQLALNESVYETFSFIKH